MAQPDPEHSNPEPAPEESNTAAAAATTAAVLTSPEGGDLLPSAAQTLTRIRDILTRARHQALQSVNAAMVQAYWEIGREIVEEEQRGNTRAEYGARLIVTLAARLTAEFGKGYEERSLRFMREVYRAFPNWNAVRAELSWTHYRLLARVSQTEARQFYLQECLRSRWSTRELERQIGSLLYERLAASRDKDGVLRLAEEGAEASTPADLLRDPYVLEFTGLPETGVWREGDLEQALMDRLQQFLLEMGRDLFFVARQQRITLEGDHFYIDLVFYHRKLRCFVLIDLKTGKLTHQDIGQMLMYVGYYREERTDPEENPPIGIILCADKNEAVARYTLSEATQQVFAARYQLYLPTEEQLLAELVRQRDTLLMERHLSHEEESESSQTEARDE